MGTSENGRIQYSSTSGPLEIGGLTLRTVARVAGYGVPRAGERPKPTIATGEEAGVATSVPLGGRQGGVAMVARVSPVEVLVCDEAREYSVPITNPTAAVMRGMSLAAAAVAAVGLVSIWLTGRARR